MTRIERAKQFMPFNALRGYYDQIRKEEFIKDERRDLTEEQIEYLGETVLTLKKGDIIKATYFVGDGYKTTTGAVSKIDLTLKYLVLIKEKILFGDIFDIEKSEENETDTCK